MKSIEVAKQELFKNSTREELRAYCKIAEIQGVKPQHQDEALTRILCRHFDITIDPKAPNAKVLASIRPKSQVTPDINLRPEGIWGGRRWRGKVHKPQNEIFKSDAGLYVFANGSYGGTKEGYYIRFGATQVIPEPIYMRLKELERTSHEQEDQPVVVDGVKHNNKVLKFTHDPMYNLDYRVEEGTENLPGSMLEWYQTKEPNWYVARDLREMQIIAKELGLETHEYNERGTKKSVVIPLESLRASVFTFVYGYAEIEIDEEIAA